MNNQRYIGLSVCSAMPISKPQFAVVNAVMNDPTLEFRFAFLEQDSCAKPADPRDARVFVTSPSRIHRADSRSNAAAIKHILPLYRTSVCGILESQSQT